MIRELETFKRASELFPLCFHLSEKRGEVDYAPKEYERKIGEAERLELREIERKEVVVTFALHCPCIRKVGVKLLSVFSLPLPTD